MLNVKNKRMNSLKEEIECSKGHLLYLIDVHIFSKVKGKIMKLKFFLSGGYQLKHDNTCLAAEDQSGV